MELDFAQLNKVYFTITDILAERQQDVGKKRFVMQNPRPTDALMLFSGANSICYQEDENPIYIPQGALVYVPKHSRYVWEDSPSSDDNRLEKLLFEFTLNYVDTKRGGENEILLTSFNEEHISFGKKIFIISTEFTSLYKKHFEKLIEAFENQDKSLIAPFSAAYDFFDILAKNSALIPNKNPNYKIIDKGIQYMEQTPCPEKSIQEIADMCGVCIGHFERMFKNYAGVSPSEFINSKKILYIKKLLQDKDLSLTDIAEKMKYCDSGYLCRFFLKRTGMTPNEYRKLYFSSIKLVGNAQNKKRLKIKKE